uniref:NADH-ubiquinone oxidoreductase chain 5 n=1 Tax=Cryptobatrachus sp. TNHC-GDC 451 TaxID=1338817 RepID=S4UZX7_9NEOB|nr:NADH dehydrogenase subunit 5 [Cryptobatrachus sp. TNHC-GDC 451]
MENNSLILLLFTVIMATLAVPLFFHNSSKFPSITVIAIAIACFISFFPACMLKYDSKPAVAATSWINVFSTPVNLSISLDFFSVTFIFIALLVTWSITEFSLWYMEKDLKINLFFKYMLIFLMFMIGLISTKNLIILFIGWEGVGLMSFLLIGWYFTRSNASLAALQAVLYNRIGDVGVLFTIFWAFSILHSIDFSTIATMKIPTYILVALIIAAASKSAQFTFHPWLASAMEGPTPVSALLHSSTMVVAGIFLLVRVHPLMKDNSTALTICLCLGAITTAYAATCALMQNDIKKIIAYSTSSQLGLMLAAIGLNLPYLAFFHICTHAFFKAMLFLCAGIIIHNLDGQQDIRKMGGLQKTFPFTSSCITAGSLALMGTPYLAGFFSKDAIIEAVNTSYINAWAIVLILLATSFTAVYSVRLIYMTFSGQPRYGPISAINEFNPLVIKPIKRLAFGSIFIGFLLFNIIVPMSTAPSLTMPTYMKILAPIISLLGFYIAYGLALRSWIEPTLNFKPPSRFSPAIYPIITHRIFTNLMLGLALRIASILMDKLWLEKTGPKGLTEKQIPSIQMIQEAQRGMIKTYLAVLSVSALILLLLFFLMN